MFAEYTQNFLKCQAWWYTSVIPATQDSGWRPQAKVSQFLSQNKL
jgi:hypothetical protein